MTVSMKFLTRRTLTELFVLKKKVRTSDFDENELFENIDSLMEKVEPEIHENPYQAKYYKDKNFQIHKS